MAPSCHSMCGKGRVVKHITKCQCMHYYLMVLPILIAPSREEQRASLSQRSMANGFFFFLMLEYKGKPFQILSSKDLEIGSLTFVGHQRASTCL